MRPFWYQTSLNMWHVRIQVTWCASNYNSKVISLLICPIEFWTIVYRKVVKYISCYLIFFLSKKWVRKAKQLQNIQPYTRCQRGGRVAQWWMTSRSIVFFLAEIRDRVQFILPWLLARQIARQNLWVEVIQPPSRVKRPLLLPLQDWPPPSVPFKKSMVFLSEVLMWASATFTPFFMLNTIWNGLFGAQIRHCYTGWD